MKHYTRKVCRPCLSLAFLELRTVISNDANGNQIPGFVLQRLVFAFERDV